MDFSKSFEKLKNRVTPYMEKMDPYVDKAKVYGEKALDFTAKQAATTPLFLRTEEAYNIHASAKRAILIAYDETDSDVKNILLLLPIWGSKAWMDNAELRYISLSEQGDLARTLKIKGPIEMHVSYNGSEFLRSNDMKEIRSWWENRCYMKEDVPSKKEKKEKAPVDPLNNIK